MEGANGVCVVDYAFRQRLSPTAKKAAAIVSKIRKYEAENTWTKVEEDEGDVFPGMCFTLAKERMERSVLWKVVGRFPKGALLHAHLEAMVDSRWTSFLLALGECIYMLTALKWTGSSTVLWRRREFISTPICH